MYTNPCLTLSIWLIPLTSFRQYTLQISFLLKIHIERHGGFLHLLFFLLTRIVILMGRFTFLKRSSKCFLEIKILTAFQYSICMLMKKWHERTLLKVFMNNCLLCIIHIIQIHKYYYVLKVRNTAQFRGPVWKKRKTKPKCFCSTLNMQKCSYKKAMNNVVKSIPLLYLLEPMEYEKCFLVRKNRASSEACQSIGE